MESRNLRIRTNSGASLDIPSDIPNSTVVDLPVGSGICYGIFGRNGYDIDSLGFAMLRSERAPTDGLSLKQLQECIRMYAPVLRLHPDEKYLATSVDYFAQHAILRNTVTNTTSKLNLSTLPIDSKETEHFKIELNGEAGRGGDVSLARTYVHVRASDKHYTDIQFWFFYAYNGPGTMRFKWLVFDSTVHAGNSTLEPFGEHEGDWEHVTLRIANATLAPTKLFYAQHSSGQWIDYDKTTKGGNGKQPVVYSSKNGHASYPSTGPNYTEHLKIPVSVIVWAEFFLVNNCADGGKEVNFANNFEIINAVDYLGKNAPEVPHWSKYKGRWGSNVSAHPDKALLEKELRAVTGKIVGSILSATVLGKLASSLLPVFFERQAGPTAPIDQKAWKEGDKV